MFLANRKEPIGHQDLMCSLFTISLPTCGPEYRVCLCVDCGACTTIFIHMQNAHLCNGGRLLLPPIFRRLKRSSSTLSSSQSWQLTATMASSTPSPGPGPWTSTTESMWTGVPSSSTSPSESFTCKFNPRRRACAARVTVLGLSVCLPRVCTLVLFIIMEALGAYVSVAG